MTHQLHRTHFTLSRALEFFNERELVAQIGFPKSWWPIAVLKELVDNALDACESAGVPPHVEVVVEKTSFTVRDNGPGLPEAVLRRSLDYLSRVSDKVGYISPTRGQQGLGLKAVWACPFVSHGSGEVEVWSQGLHHTLAVSLDRLTQQAVVDHRVAPAPEGFIKTGTNITVHWPEAASSLREPEGGHFYETPPPTAWELLAQYAVFNPHATFILKEGDREEALWKAPRPGWPKWKPSDPVSPHWYDVASLREHLATHIAAERHGGPPRTVWDFVGDFRGLSAMAKRKQVAAGLLRTRLGELVRDGDLDLALVERLLQAMQAHSSPVPARALGIIGREPLTTWLVETAGVVRDSVRYTRRLGNGALPWVLEVAFGISLEDEAGRRLAVGLNWSPALQVPMPELMGLLGEMRIDPHDPVALVVHLARPRIAFADRAKSRIVLPPDLTAALGAAVRQVAGAWQRAKRREDRIARQKREQLARQTRSPLSLKAAAFAVMEEAYYQASGHGQYYATARQIMYAARPLVLHRTGGLIWKDSQYFTQSILKDFLERYRPEWKVVWDARGHLREPHTGREIELSDIAVERYLRSWTGEFEVFPAFSLGWERPIATCGPTHRYKAAIFVEKEGFDFILKEAGIEQRFDCAVMSTKGLTIAAACRLVHALHQAGVRVLVVRDFDLAGFKLIKALRFGVRSFPRAPGTPVIDVGFRGADTQGLPREAVVYAQKRDPRDYLRLCGATDEELTILVQRRRGGCWEGERVELNAMPSDRFVAWLESKLLASGVQKVIPDPDTLAQAYRRARFLEQLERMVEQVRATLSRDAGEIPPDLAARVAALLARDPSLAWDQAIAQLVAGERRRRRRRER